MEWVGLIVLYLVLFGKPKLRRKSTDYFPRASIGPHDPPPSMFKE